jgi:hypothetical protein
MGEREEQDQDTSKIAVNAAPTPDDVPRYASFVQGPVGLQNQVRAVMYFNRKRRLARIAANGG